VNPAEILAIVQLFTVLEPQVVTAINSAIQMFQSSSLSNDDKMKMLTDIQAALKPMQLKE
jgi:hypothetical protein